MSICRRQASRIALLTILLPLVTACGPSEPSNSAVVPVPRNTFWLKLHEEINARVARGNADLVFIGDSIMQRWHEEGRKVWDRFYGRRNAANLGITGDCTQHVIWRLQHGNFDGIKPKVAVVMIGTNNSKTNTPDETAAGLRKIISIVREKSPKTKILLLGILPRERDRTSKRRLINIKVNEIISGFADDKHVYYLDFGDRFVDEDGKLSTELMRDNQHPSAAGYLVWAEVMEPVLAGLLEEE